MMRTYGLKLLLILSVFVTVSCSTNKQFINRSFSNLEGKAQITAVIVGNPFFESRWISQTSSDFNVFMRGKLNTVFNSEISVINSSAPEDTFNAFSRRIEQDVLSYQPDIVFFMLGLVDSNQAEQTLTYFRDHVRKVFGKLEQSGTTVIVLTSIGFQSAINPYDPAMERLEGFNEVIIWEAGHHNFALIDVAEYFERLRISDYDRYYSLFLNELMLNQTGREYVFDYVFNFIGKSYKTQ